MLDELGRAPGHKGLLEWREAYYVAGQSRIVRRFVIVVAMLTVSVSTTIAQLTSSAIVMVRVADTARIGIGDAELVLATGDSTITVVRTDSDGHRTIKIPVRTEPYRLTVLKLGYISTRRLVQVSTDDTLLVDIRLLAIPESKAVALPAVKTEASRGREPADTFPELERAGFYERKRSALAPQTAFVTADQMLHWNVNRLPDIDVISGRSVMKCSIYLNGAYVPLDSASLEQNIQVSDLEGVEVYRPIEAPIQYPVRGRSTCVALLWLK